MSAADDVTAPAPERRAGGRPSAAHHHRRHERRDDLRLRRHHGGHLQPVRVLARRVRPTFFWGWLLVGLSVGLACLVYAELASHYPFAASFYHWPLQLVGRRVGWWVGWMYLGALLSLVAAYTIVMPGILGPLFDFTPWRRAETGVPVGYQRVGGLALAQQPERMAQLRRSASMAAHFGVDVQIISRDEAKELWPLAQLDDVIGAAWLPDDGRAEPATAAARHRRRRAGAGARPCGRASACWRCCTTGVGSAAFAPIGGT